MENERENYCFSKDTEQSEIVFVTYGKISARVLDAASQLRCSHSVGTIRLKRIFPLDASELDTLTHNAKLVITVEEAMSSGGVGEKLASALTGTSAGRRIRAKAINGFIPHGTNDELIRLAGLDGESLAEFAKNEFGIC